MGSDYDNDDYNLTVDDLYSSVDYFDTLSDNELDQYDDSRQIYFEQLESRVGMAEDQLSHALNNDEDENVIERLQDELELLLIDYFNFEM
tara:strand:- start:629 stop:898 length:270 start_codon:yes stop_codon:yes gene_type:complete